MSIDTDRLLSALENESLRKYYYGDLFHDAAAAIKKPSVVDDLLDDFECESLSQLPAEDFLHDVIDEICEIKKLNKKEMIERLSNIAAWLEDIQQTQLYASEHAKDVINKYRKN